MPSGIIFSSSMAGRAPLEDPGFQASGEIHFLERDQEGVLHDIPGVVGGQSVPPGRPADERQKILAIEGFRGSSEGLPWTGSNVILR